MLEALRAPLKGMQHVSDIGARARGSFHDLVKHWKVPGILTLSNVHSDRPEMCMTLFSCC